VDPALQHLVHDELIVAGQWPERMRQRTWALLASGARLLVLATI